MSLSEPYDRMGRVVDDHMAHSVYNAFYDRPAVLEVLGDVAGLDIIDAACGPGHYAAELVARGARVRGFDASATMVQLATERLGDAVDLQRASLDDRLPYDDASADLVLCALAIHYAADRAATMREFARVLRPGGRCVMSTQHPMWDWIRKGGSYFDVVLETDVWGPWSGGQSVSYWREPLTATVAAATNAGMLVRGLIEPLPSPAMAEVSPDDFRKLSEAPAFIILDLLKP